jgi:transposase
MSNMTKSPATTPIPVQLSGPEFITFIFPHLSMPIRGPKCKLGYHRVFNLILWVLYTGMQWKCMPVPRASDGTALIHYTTIYKVFAKWADDGSLDQAFIASVRHLAEQHHLDLNILQASPTRCRASPRASGRSARSCRPRSTMQGSVVQTRSLPLGCSLRGRPKRQRIGWPATSERSPNG